MQLLKFVQHAAIMEFLSRVEDELRCPSCHQLFIDAVFLPCSHSLCLQCAVRLATTTASSSSTTSALATSPLTPLSLVTVSSSRSTTQPPFTGTVFAVPTPTVPTTPGCDVVGNDHQGQTNNSLQFLSSATTTTTAVSAISPLSLTDQSCNCAELDRDSVNSETDSGVVCTSNGGAISSSSLTGVSPCSSTAPVGSRPNSYVGTDISNGGSSLLNGAVSSEGGIGSNTPSVGNLSTTSSQDCTSNIASSCCGSTPTAAVGLTITCPSCRRLVACVDAPTPTAVLAVLPRNRSLEAIVDRYRETKHLPLPCQRCHQQTSGSVGSPVSGGTAAAVEPATLACEQCVALFCDKCYETKHSVGGKCDNVGTPSTSGDHAVTRPAAKGKAWLTAAHRGESMSCPDHIGETQSLYCTHCRTSVCCICTEADARHEGHKVKPLGATAKSHKADLSQLLHSLSEKVKASTEVLQKLKGLQDQIEVNSHELELQVRRHCDVLIEAVERRRSELISSISQHRLRKHQSFHEHMSDCTTKLHRNTGLLQFAIELLKETDPSAFLQTSSSLISRVSNLIDSLDRELLMEPRVTPQFELFVDTEPTLLAIEAMDLHEIKVPRQPAILVDACVVENNVITVAWKGHVTNRASDVVTYVLELDDGNGGPFREVYRGYQSACTVEGLHFDAEYRTRVKAINKAGSSEYSSIVRIHTSEVAYFSLDPQTAHQDVLFSNDNMTVTSSSFDDRVVLGSVGLSRGVHYWELSIDRYENNKDPAFGVALLGISRDRMIGKDEYGWSMYIDNSRSWFMHSGRHSDRTPGGITVGSVVGVQLDLNRRTLSFYVNGELQGGIAHRQLPPGAVFYPAVSLNRNVQVSLMSGLTPVVTDDADLCSSILDLDN